MLHSRPNIHPGEILREEFLKPAGVDVDRLARDIKMPKDHLDQLVCGSGVVCIDTALRLSRYFGTSERFWLEMQMTYDLEHARRSSRTAVDAIRPLDAA